MHREAQHALPSPLRVRETSLGEIHVSEDWLQVQWDWVVDGSRNSSLLKYLLHGFAFVDFDGVLRVGAGVSIADDWYLRCVLQQVVVSGSGSPSAGEFFVEDVELGEQYSCLDCVEAAVYADGNVGGSGDPVRGCAVSPF